jgi:superfamily II DNA or RNA helicase
MFKKAERKKAKLKIAITGPSGSGKTYSALQLATGLGKKIALIDTENDSASLYADRFEFDTLNIEPPFTIKKYLEAMKAAQAGGYDVLVIDSLSHAWAGEGGILERKSAKDNQGGNSYTNWAQFTKEHEEFKSALLYADIHVIGNMRSKQDYVM